MAGKITITRIYGVLLQLWFLATAPFRRNLVTHQYPSVHHIDYRNLKDRGISLVIFDLDDTIANWHTTVPKKVEELFDALQREIGIDIAVFTNSTKRRALRVSTILTPRNISITQNPNKPMIAGYKDIFSQHNVHKEQVAMVGDRLATDMWGAQRAGIPVRILVEPYSNYMEGYTSPFIQKIMRTVEKTLNGYYFR